RRWPTSAGGPPGPGFTAPGRPAPHAGSSRRTHQPAPAPTWNGPAGPQARPKRQQTRIRNPPPPPLILIPSGFSGRSAPGRILNSRGRSSDAITFSRGECSRRARYMANPTLYALAQMAEKAYMTDNGRGQQQSMALFQGDYQAQQGLWQHVSGGNRDAEGFLGCMFYANDKSHTVVAFAGTDIKSWEDIKADLRLGSGWPPKQAEAAELLVKTAKAVEHGD